MMQRLLLNTLTLCCSALRQRGTLPGLALSHVAEHALREALRDFNPAFPRATE